MSEEMSMWRIYQHDRYIQRGQTEAHIIFMLGYARTLKSG